MTGWIKLHREYLSNPTIARDAEHFAVWAYLLLNACYEGSTGIFGGRVIELRAGELLISQRQICEQLKIDKSKMGRILNCFKSERLIETQTDKHKTLVSIVFWDKEQGYSETENETEVRHNRDTEQEREKEKEKSSKREKEKEKEIYKKVRRKEAPEGRTLYDLSKWGFSKEPSYGDADEFFALAVARSYEDDEDDEPLDTSDQPSAVSC